MPGWPATSGLALVRVLYRDSGIAVLLLSLLTTNRWAQATAAATARRLAADEALAGDDEPPEPPAHLPFPVRTW